MSVWIVPPWSRRTISVVLEEGYVFYSITRSHSLLFVRNTSEENDHQDHTHHKGKYIWPKRNDHAAHRIETAHEEHTQHKGNQARTHLKDGRRNHQTIKENMNEPASWPWKVIEVNRHGGEVDS